MRCPICTVNRATSTHHIKPRGSDDSDNPKNKVTLCKSCYDRVEEVCGNTGAKLSPQLIDLMKLEHGFPDGSTDKDIAESVLATTLYRMRRQYKFARKRRAKVEVQEGVSIRCPRCNGWHFPDKNGAVRCPVFKVVVISAEETLAEIDAAHNILIEKIKRIRASVEQ